MLETAHLPPTNFKLFTMFSGQPKLEATLDNVATDQIKPLLAIHNCNNSSEEETICRIPKTAEPKLVLHADTTSSLTNFHKISSKVLPNHPGGSSISR